MPKGIIKTEEEINQLSPEQQIRRKRDSLRICAMDAQKRADNWVERAEADPTDETARLMVPRSQAKADEAQARYAEFARINPPAPRKKAAKKVKDNSFNIDDMVKAVKTTDLTEAFTNPPKAKRVRKPLTEAQRLARNEKARQRRAAKKAEATA